MRFVCALGVGVLLAAGGLGPAPCTAPGRPNPLIPMGAITGKPDERIVRETLEAYKSVGIDQYLIYPRSEAGA